MTTTQKAPAGHASIPTAWLQDETVSLRARGLLAHLSTYDTMPTVAEIVQASPEGRDAIRTAFRELEQAGYLHRERGGARVGHSTGGQYVLTGRGAEA